MSKNTPDQPPCLAEALAVWAERTPDPDAPVGVQAAWYELKVDLLQPITTDPWHPEQKQAQEFASVARHTAKVLRDKEAGR